MSACHHVRGMDDKRQPRMCRLRPADPGRARRLSRRLVAAPLSGPMLRDRGYGHSRLQRVQAWSMAKPGNGPKDARTSPAVGNEAAGMTAKPRYMIILTPMPSADLDVPDPVCRLRRILKWLGRKFRYQCLCVEELKTPQAESRSIPNEQANQRGPTLEGIEAAGKVVGKARTVRPTAAASVNNGNQTATN